ncbi:unnamed protein product [Schistosoma curassoni]|uniref:Peptidase A2 domain-containing protein n=1 Tax=Schistosoma curassoni TaxID=6186 RepID=A0A183KYC2_9TREM|nr:unnamed protein product [Schistosoma curassoni]
MPPKGIQDLKTTILRLTAANKLSSTTASIYSTAMAIQESGVARQFDPAQTLSAVNYRPSRQPPRINQQNRKTECFYCQRFDRRAKKCGHNRVQNIGKTCRYHISSCYAKHVCPVTIRGKVQNTEIDILLDTGASVSLIKEDLLQKLNHKTQRKQCSSALITASGDPLKACSKIGLELTIDKNSFQH